MENQFFLGVDGGATKTEAVLTDARDRIFGQATTGPSNVHSAGRTTALASIRTAVQRAMGRYARRVTAVGVGLAGVDTDTDQRRMIRALRPILQPLVGARFLVVNDIHAGYATGVTKLYGVTVIAGTGSHAYARGRDAYEAYAGGLGRTLSDEGSAYAIGQAVLRAAVRSSDGRVPPTRLEASVFRHFRITHIRALLPIMHRPSFTKADIAHVAPLADAAARRGDRIARSILLDAADELATMARAVMRRTGLTRGACELVLVGGVFRSGVVRTRFQKQVRTFAPRVRFIRPTVPVAVGAARLARARWG